MKKLFLSMSILASSLMFGQFNLTPNNFVSVENPEKDYIVLEFPNEPQKELFQRVKMHFTSKYKNMKWDGYNEVENRQIVLDASGTKNITAIFNIAGANVWRADIRYEINFRDEKIMIKPILTKIQNVYEAKTTLSIDRMFKNRGNKQDKIIKMAEDEVNDVVNYLQKELNKKEEW